MESSLKNMIKVLTLICLVTSAALGIVYKFTYEPIQVAQKNKLIAALSEVLPQYDNNPLETERIIAVEVDGNKSETIVYTAQKGNENVGYAIMSSAIGFSGDINLMTGFDASGKILNIRVLSMSETPGLGANMTKDDNVLLASFKNKDAGKLNMKVKKDGGDIDALTASTISSRSYAAAVRIAYEAFLKVNTATDVAETIEINASSVDEGGENE